MATTAQHQSSVRPLTDNQKTRRLEFTQLHVDWPEDSWKQTIFSDEFTFRIQFGGGVDRQAKTIPAKCVINTTFLTVWGAIHANGRCPLVFLQDRVEMNQFVYMDALHKCFHPFQNRPTWVLYDQLPAHRSGMVTHWQENVASWGVLLTPSHSSDLNPVETV